MDPTHETEVKINTDENYIDEEDVEEEEEEEEVEEEIEEEDESESVLSESTWISSFCSMLGHEYFAEVSEDFIEDDFNLTNLSSMVPMYKEALEMILDVEPEPSSSEASDGGDPDYSRARKKFSANDNLSVVESSSELLYGLIHQRYILSRQGMQQMYDKYLAAHFGHCPRVYCNNARVLPCGSSDTPCADTVKLYCPCCMDVYLPPNSRFQTVDGAYFGTSFASLFLMTYGDVDVSTASHKTPAVIPPPSQRKSSNASSTPGVVNGFAVQNIAPGLGVSKTYDMKIYGFKVSERSKSGPRMKWLRSKPDDVTVLDEATRKLARRKKKSLPSDVDMEVETEAKGGLLEMGGQETAEPPRRVMKKPVRRLRSEDGAK